jgi:hypothetical protein
LSSADQPDQSFRDFSSPISKAFLAGFAAGRLLIDCPKMEVRQLGAGTEVYRGRGMLTLAEGAEEFQLRIYVDEGMVDSGYVFKQLQRMGNWISGEVIPNEEFFSLSAVDLSGYEWTCDKFQITVHPGRHGAVITGKLGALRCRISGLSSTPTSSMVMYFFDELPVPYTELVTTESATVDRTLSSQSEPLRASFNAGGLDFLVQKVEPDSGSTIIRVSSANGQLPEGLESRVEESLRYVTFSPVRWCIVNKVSAGSREIFVVPRKSSRAPLFDEPLDHHRREHAGDFWRLFSAYFGHVIPHQEPQNYHPLSAQLFHVISSETKQLDLSGLLVSIAVEGVLNVEYADLARPTDVFRSSLDRIAKLMRRLKCVDENLAARLAGALNAMKSSRPADKLKVLEQAGVITRDMTKAWQRLRNSTAHAAARSDPAQTEAMYGESQIVYAMLNRLIFQAIGYSGRYQNFSARNWPIETFAVANLADL